MSKIRPTVAIAGASGFIGSALVPLLSKDLHVVAISRRAAHGDAGQPEVEWRQADLFSLLQVERALRGADIGLYLVHSMQPISRLTQGSFADIDLILADNFARAARKFKVRRIVYLGGIIPPHHGGDEDLSPHLRSRLEVERVLASYGAEVITVRSGLVVGRDGSSFRILESLVQRLPLMLCPRWTRTLGQPIALSDLVEIMRRAILDPSLPAGAYNVGGPDILSYVDMMRAVARTLHVRRRFYATRFFTPALSRLWLSLITGASRALIYPLVESLKHEMLVGEPVLQQRYQIRGRSFEEALVESLHLASDKPARAARATAAARPVSLLPASAAAGDNTVCSIQRVQVPPGRGVNWAAHAYSRWLPRFLAPLIRVDADQEGSMRFYLQPLGVRTWAILALQLLFSAERSDETRSLFYITGGLLSDNRQGKQPGRFEFRQVPGRNEVVIAILNYQPRLPWWFYTQTQARVHLLVMHAFGRMTRRLAQQQARLVSMAR